MVFSDLFFLFGFIPAFALCYLLGAWVDRTLLAKNGQQSFAMKNTMLVVFSLIFYAWGEPVYVFLMVASVLVNFLVGRWIHASQGSRRRLALTLGLIANIGIICTFKYLGFFAEVLNDLGLAVPVPKIALPIGISFYTFQSISYLIDVYRQDARVQRRFVDLLLYISMFPQLIAGPIVRYGTVAEELLKRHVSATDFAEGAYRFFIGLGKKVIIANQLGEIADQFLKNGLDTASTVGAWIGIVAFTLQIYFDFSGYSDMAIGMGRCMGFHFNENFDHPYCSRSITEFWRRWHMSLGSFFRDYVYIPLGGNRRHQLFNIVCVWFLTGMWHGASWNFILWGLFFGFILVVEKFVLKNVLTKTPALLLHIYTLLIVTLSFGIFYFDSMPRMGIFFSSAFGGSESFFGFVDKAALMDNFWLWVVAILLCMPIRKQLGTWLGRVGGENSALAANLTMVVRLMISIAILVLSVALLVGATNNAFLYTRF